MVDLPQEEDLQIEALATVFNDTTNSYKYYWFLSILEAITDSRSDGYPIEEISTKMFLKVLYPLKHSLLSFGKSDGFKGIADFITEYSTLDFSLNSELLSAQIEGSLPDSEKKEYEQRIKSLSRWVPYRFLRPFFAIETRGIPDSKVNKRITELSRLASIKNPERCPYYFLGNRIIINQNWKEYFVKNMALLNAFCYWHLTKFLQKNNPNVPGIPEKLFSPSKRSMKKYIESWKQFVHLKPDSKCIYSGSYITNDFSLDHFIPWSFVTHDLNWNLIPTGRTVNSSKSNNLPDLKKYIIPFSEMQYIYYQTIFPKMSFNKILEDYSILFNLDLEDIYHLPRSSFIKIVIDTIRPMEQIAANMGYSRGWTF